MYFSPFYYFPDSAVRATSYIRISHASPDAPPVDVYANGRLIAQNLSYRGFTEYLRVIPGRYSVSLFLAGQLAAPVVSANIEALPNTISTIAAIGQQGNISLLDILDPVLPIPSGKTMLRFSHLSPNAPNVDVVQTNGTLLFGNTGYTQTTDYIPVTPGAYSVYIEPVGTTQSVLYVPNINLLPGRFYTIYGVGLLGGTPPLQALIPLDGNSYIKF